ncbi:hypothetical protein C8J57DRAFT_1715979 [Mycena rebaudengoi]|nr:hypothetical protein C8J57DRAFT_1715979 [Mycena rebaudengoi]
MRNGSPASSVRLRYICLHSHTPHVDNDAPLPPYARTAQSEDGAVSSTPKLTSLSTQNTAPPLCGAQDNAPRHSPDDRGRSLGSRPHWLRAHRRLPPILSTGHGARARQPRHYTRCNRYSSLTEGETHPHQSRRPLRHAPAVVSPLSTKDPRHTRKTSPPHILDVPRYARSTWAPPTPARTADTKPRHAPAVTRRRSTRALDWLGAARHETPAPHTGNVPTPHTRRPPPASKHASSTYALPAHDKTTNASGAPTHRTTGLTQRTQQAVN